MNYLKVVYLFLLIFNVGNNNTLKAQSVNGLEIVLYPQRNIFYEGEFSYQRFIYYLKNKTDKEVNAIVLCNKAYLKNSLSNIEIKPPFQTKHYTPCFGWTIKHDVWKIKAQDSLHLDSFFGRNYDLKQGSYELHIVVPIEGGDTVQTSFKFIVLPAIQPEYDNFTLSLKEYSKLNREVYEYSTEHPLIKFIHNNPNSIYTRGAIAILLQNSSQDYKSSVKQNLSGLKTLLSDSLIVKNIIKTNDYEFIRHVSGNYLKPLMHKNYDVFGSEEKRTSFFNSYLKKLEDKNPQLSDQIISDFARERKSESNKLKNFSKIKHQR